MEMRRHRICREVPGFVIELVRSSRYLRNPVLGFSMNKNSPTAKVALLPKNECAIRIVKWNPGFWFCEKNFAESRTNVVEDVQKFAKRFNVNSNKGFK